MHRKAYTYTLKVYTHAYTVHCSNNKSNAIKKNNQKKDQICRIKIFRIELDLRGVIFSYLTGTAEIHAAQLCGALYTEILLNESLSSRV